MRTLPLLALLVACEPGSFKIGDTGGDSSGPVEGDGDGDGHAALDNGGDDCDDANPEVYPGAIEVWYDGVDQDCDAGSDFDQDGDGADQSPTGDDCDDLDPTVRPGATEIQDLVDQDCDGVADEDFIAAGAIVVTEVMHHPLAASDADGEWFEVANTEPNAIDLMGWTITSDDGDSITITSSLPIQAGSRVVLGANANAALNGGVVVDYAYDRATMSLSAADTLFLNMGTTTVFDMEWTSDWSMTDGASVSLDPDHMDVTEARQPGYWCVATSDMGTGDLGTPGAANDDCTSLDEDGDGYSVDDGDCNDSSAAVSPGAADVWDGWDNDCSGTADEGSIGDVAVGSADGGSNSFLSVFEGLGLGDVTGDGTVDLLVGGALQSSYAGAIYVISGDDYNVISGAASGDAVATVSGTAGGGGYGYFGATSPLAGDIDGDGTADLVVASGSSSWGAGTAIGVYSGGSDLTGSLDAGDADLTVTASSSGNASYGNNRVVAHLDMNGDGLADLAYAMPNATDGGSWYKGQIAVIDASNLSGDVAVDDADLILTGDSSQDYLGMGMGGMDVDGDGYDDLYVGATGQDDYADDGGAWYQIDGGATWGGEEEVDSASNRTLSGADDDAQIGIGAPAFGDLDDDGLIDLAFGGADADQVWVFYDIGGRTSNLDTEDADLVIDGDSSSSFGFTVAAGDFDEDGADDLVVGAPAVASTSSAVAYWYYTAGTDTGAVFLFDGPSLGRGTADEDDAWASATGESRGDLFGAVMSGVADINGDGAADVLVGAPRGGTNLSGRAYVIKGQ